MSSTAAHSASYAEYLAVERASEHKHEFFDGRILAMAGGTPAHALLIGRVGRLVGNALAGKPCLAFSSELRIRVQATGLATYPDASVVCGPLERHREDAHAVTNPTVLVEVLSKSTEGYDRGQKFAHYRQIPSLKTYALISQDRDQVEVYERNDDDSWTFRSFGPGDAAVFGSIEISMDVDALYDGVDAVREPADADKAPDA